MLCCTSTTGQRTTITQLAITHQFISRSIIMDTVTTFITALMVTMSTQSIHHKVAEIQEVIYSSSFVASSQFYGASAFA